MKELKLNNRLRAARVQNIWTLEEAAENVGVDVQTFWRWEHYEQWPRPYSLRKLCAVLGMSAEELGFERCSCQISK